mmetsp:Transcript_30143/g.53001  ORF Transcript_30143/g.53001 Transcript_30143/m.53001 type:complete len:501 (+) Transcript_30143:3-1505(+)
MSDPAATMQQPAAAPPLPAEPAPEGQPTQIPADVKAAIDFKNQGNEQLKKKNLKEAIASYTKGIEACSKPEIRGPILGNRSQAHRRLRDFKNALADANEAVQIFPNYARGHVRKAYVLREMKEWKDCKTAIEDAFSLGLEFKDDDERNMKALLSKSAKFIKQAETAERLALIFSKLKGKWNGAVPEELGGGSQELDFKSETEVILTVPAKQLSARLKLDVTQEPMWLDITIPIPTNTGQTIEHMMPHLFEFNEDFTDLHLMGPPDQGLQPGFPLRRPDSIDKESKSYVLMKRGAAAATPEEKEVEMAVEETKGKGEDARVLKYCQLMSKKLGDAIRETGFKFEEPKAHWPEEDIKRKYTSMLRMSQYIYVLDKHFGQTTCGEVNNLVKGLKVASSPEMREAVDELRKHMIAAGMHKPSEQPAQTAPPATNAPSTENFQDHLFSDKQTEVKESKSSAPKSEPRGMNALTLVLLGAATASAIMGLAYFLFGGSRKSRKENKY